MRRGVTLAVSLVSALAASQTALAGDGIRIGVARGSFVDVAGAETARHFEEVVERFSQLGARVEEVVLPPEFEESRGALWSILRVGFATNHGTTFHARPDDYGPRLRVLIEDGLAMPATTYARALDLQSRLAAATAAAIAVFDAVITPTVPEPAPRGLESTGNADMLLPWTLLGFPTIALPSGWSESGLPLSIQLAAAPSAERRLLEASAWCEQMLSFESPVPA